MANTSVEVFKDVMSQSISNVTDPRLSRHPDGHMIIQQLNVMLAKILQTANATTTLWLV